jgi:uncharacterized SAM-binding protein YcdF (DUF218 family)
MLHAIIGLAKQTLLPGTLGFLIIGVAAGAVLLRRGQAAQRWGRGWVAFLAAAYWILSIPIGADALVACVGYGYGPVDAATARGADAVVVLDGGALRFRNSGGEIAVVSRASALRVIEALRVYRLADRPWLVVTGGTYGPPNGTLPEGEAVRAALIQAGVDPKRIVLDSTSRNTREHALNIGRILHEHGAGRFVLVTSHTHIRRALGAFREAGLDPIPSAAPVWPNGDRSLWERARFWPSTDTLQVSADALYDAFGLVYYRMRGWM